ncbi:MAG TPA: diphthine--ammonia ligase [Thermoleophilia bacterium]|nr:diphthine--ammonia ligase [Thermoleophilia bacterium]
MASDAPRTDVPSANGRSAGASLAASRFFCSWSGGKDAYLALQRAVERGGAAAALVCMLHEDGGVSRGHGLPLALLEEQAAALGVPLVTRATTWDGYESTFVALLHELRAQGIEAGVFGDIDLQAHRDWVEGVCEVAGLGCHLPLWQEPRRRLLAEFLAGDSRATIVAVDSSKLSPEFLGLVLDDAVIARLEAAGADACGEEGEYHTMVTAAPLFSRPVPLVWDGVEERDGHHLLRDMRLGATVTPAAPPAGASPQLVDIVRSRLVKDRRESPPS